MAGKWARKGDSIEAESIVHFISRRVKSCAIEVHCCHHWRAHKIQLPYRTDRSGLYRTFVSYPSHIFFLVDGPGVDDEFSRRVLS